MSPLIIEGVFLNEGVLGSPGLSCAVCVCDGEWEPQGPRQRRPPPPDDEEAEMKQRTMDANMTVFMRELRPVG